jgi:hypothetical protein
MCATYPVHIITEDYPYKVLYISPNDPKFIYVELQSLYAAAFVWRPIRKHKT